MKIFSSKPKNKFGCKLSNPKELRHHSQQKYISPPPEEKKPTTKETLTRFHPITKLIPEIQKNKRQLNESVIGIRSKASGFLHFNLLNNLDNSPEIK